MYFRSKLAFVQILMSRIKLSVTIIIGQLTLTRCYTYAKRKYTKLLYKVPLALNLCLLFFIKFLFFYQMITLWKHEKHFLFHLKSYFRSRDIQMFVTFSLPFHTFQIQKDKWKWNNLWCNEFTCINLQMLIFVITQKLLYITSSNLIK